MNKRAIKKRIPTSTKLFLFYLLDQDLHCHIQRREFPYQANIKPLKNKSSKESLHTNKISYIFCDPHPLEDFLYFALREGFQIKLTKEQVLILLTAKIFLVTLTRPL